MTYALLIYSSLSIQKPRDDTSALLMMLQFLNLQKCWRKDTPNTTSLQGRDLLFHLIDIFLYAALYLALHFEYQIQGHFYLLFNTGIFFFLPMSIHL